MQLLRLVHSHRPLEFAVTRDTKSWKWVTLTFGVLYVHKYVCYCTVYVHTSTGDWYDSDPHPWLNPTYWAMRRLKPGVGGLHRPLFQSRKRFVPRAPPHNLGQIKPYSSGGHLRESAANHVFFFFFCFFFLPKVLEILPFIATVRAGDGTPIERFFWGGFFCVGIL